MSQNAPSLTPDLETPTHGIIDVSAGLIFHHRKLLITKRPADAHLGGLWEFPGGKCEANESFEECLIREVQEELGVVVFVVSLLESLTYTYPEKTVRLKFFLCRLSGGEPRPLGCAAVKWVGRKELASHKLPAADARLLEHLRQPKFWL